jgi:hypothetical protein
MKRLISIFLVLFSFNTLADLPDVVAFVNDRPITKYDFEARKKMIVELNNIDISDPGVNSNITSNILNILIEEELLIQQAKKVGGEVSEEEIDNSILSIEQRNEMPKGGMKELMEAINLNTESFRKQVKGELIKHNIVNSLSQSVSVSPNEVDIALINSYQDFDIESWIFTSKSGDEKSKGKMQLLKKRLSSCNKIDDKLFADFADGKKFDRKLTKLLPKTQSVLLDTKVGASSNIYKQGNLFKMVLVCRKDSGVSKNDLNKIESFLSNKKVSKKTTKFFKDLKVKSDIKIMMPGL